LDRAAGDFEFASAAEVGEVDRRTFLRVMAASFALASAGCSPAEEALPYVNAPERLVPGTPRRYATALSFEGYAVPVIAETHLGRPTKLEGNPDHPASGGATDAEYRPGVQELYDR
jgi:molybdopterin-containing oxidoreductase family iron-sulfur binding subunit